MKDLLMSMVKAVFESILKVALEALKKLDWRAVAYKSYVEFKPKLEVKVKDSESKVDDAGIKALDVLMDKFVKPEEEEVAK